MCAINLGLNGPHGWAVCQNALKLACHRVYRIGMHFEGQHPGVIRETPVDQSPIDFKTIEHSEAMTIPAMTDGTLRTPGEEQTGRFSDGELA